MIYMQYVLRFRPAEARVPQGRDGGSRHKQRARAAAGGRPTASSGSHRPGSSEKRRRRAADGAGQDDDSTSRAASTGVASVFERDDGRLRRGRRRLRWGRRAAAGADGGRRRVRGAAAGSEWLSWAPRRRLKDLGACESGPRCRLIWGAGELLVGAGCVGVRVGVGVGVGVRPQLTAAREGPPGQRASSVSQPAGWFRSGGCATRGSSSRRARPMMASRLQCEAAGLLGCWAAGPGPSGCGWAAAAAAAGRRRLQKRSQPTADVAGVGCGETAAARPDAREGNPPCRGSVQTAPASGDGLAGRVAGLGSGVWASRRAEIETRSRRR